MSKIEFKEFVKKNTNLIGYVEQGKTTWQKLYELYDLYGENSNVWDKYLKTSTTSSASTSGSSSFKDLVNMIKGVDLDTVQNCLTSLDKAIDAFKGIIPNIRKENGAGLSNYEPRPTYKYFED